MIRFIVSRLVGMVLVLIVVSLITFLIFQAVPLLARSSPVYYYIGKAPATPELLKTLTHRFGFDQPLPVQYWSYLAGFFGKNITDGTTIITESVFNLRGLGALSIQAIRDMDLPVMLGVTVVAAFALVVANFIVDLLYAVIDPRVTV